MENTEPGPPSLARAETSTTGDDMDDKLVAHFDGPIKYEPKRHYQPTIVRNHTGPDTTQRIYRFENGYGASVVPEYDPSSYTDLVPVQGELELAVIYWDDKDDFHLLNWNDPILVRLDYDDNPIRRISQDEVDTLLDKIAGL